MMSNIGLVIATGIKNVFRIKIMLFVLISITLICAVSVILLICLLLIKPEVESVLPDKAALAGYVGLIIYSSMLISIGVTLNSLVFQTMVKEKARGNLTALLATPLRLSEVWLGKSLALFLPGLVIGVVLTLLTWLIINAIYFLPDIGFIFGLQMAISTLIALPLMYLFFGIFVHSIGLMTKPSTGNVIAQVFLPVIANVTIQVAVRTSMDANSWGFVAMNFGIAFIMGGLILAIRPYLTLEKVVLSG